MLRKEHLRMVTIDALRLPPGYRQVEAPQVAIDLPPVRQGRRRALVTMDAENTAFNVKPIEVFCFIALEHNTYGVERWHQDPLHLSERQARGLDHLAKRTVRPEALETLHFLTDAKRELAETSDWDMSVGFLSARPESALEITRQQLEDAEPGSSDMVDVWLLNPTGLDPKYHKSRVAKYMNDNDVRHAHVDDMWWASRQIGKEGTDAFLLRKKGVIFRVPWVTGKNVTMVSSLSEFADIFVASLKEPSIEVQSSGTSEFADAASFALTQSGRIF